MFSIPLVYQNPSRLLPFDFIAFVGWIAKYEIRGKTIYDTLSICRAISVILDTFNHS